ncbi:MAG: C39 family peptidase [Patescibacteria group bacterium]
MYKYILVLIAIFAPLSYASAQDVPFLSQAPTGQWNDIRQAQGCEEAASIMAVAWARGQTSIDLKQGRDRIVGISDWEFRNYGHFIDTSIQDTAERIIKGYLKFDDITIKHNITVKDIAAEVYAGKIVITAINGRKLPNPHYKWPGPLHHELVVTAYDRESDVFTVNDPGTIFGRSLQFTGKQLQFALQDYESGSGKSRKALPPAMIVFERL